MESSVSVYRQETPQTATESLSSSILPNSSSDGVITGVPITSSIPGSGPGSADININNTTQTTQVNYNYNNSNSYNDSHNNNNNNNNNNNKWRMTQNGNGNGNKIGNRSEGDVSSPEDAKVEVIIIIIVKLATFVYFLYTI